VSLLSETLSSCNCVYSSLSSKSLIFISIEIFSVLRLFSSNICCLYFSLSFRILHIEVDRLTAYLLLHYSQSSRTENPPYLHVGRRRPGIFLPQEFLLPSQTHR
jgi:hypothetical protein